LGCGEWNKLAQVHDASPAGLAGGCRAQLASVTCTASQGSVERRKSAGTTQAARDLYGSPLRRRRWATVNLAQQCTLTAVYNEPVRVPQLVPNRIEYMEVSNFLGVEAICGRRRRQADRHGLSSPQVEASQPHMGIGFLTAVDSRPHLHKIAVANADVEAAATEQCQKLSCGCYTALRVEKGVEITSHGNDRQAIKAADSTLASSMWMNRRLGITQSPASVRKLDDLRGVSAADTHARGKGKGVSIP
jgi:hypothetical protein